MFRTAYTNPPPKGLGSVDCSLEADLCKQEFKEECDINRIMRRYGGEVPLPVPGDPLYGDFSELGAYEDALQVLQRAGEQFESLPAQVRDRFANDPARFLAFVKDPTNTDEAVKLGLCVAPVPPAPKAPPMEVIVVDGANFAGADK